MILNDGQDWGCVLCPLPRIPPGIPCELAALARVPLRFTKGTFAPRPPGHTPHTRFACARPFRATKGARVPACAGMTCMGAGIPRSHRCACSRPLTLREGGVRGIIACR